MLTSAIFIALFNCFKLLRRGFINPSILIDWEVLVDNYGSGYIKAGRLNNVTGIPIVEIQV